MDWTGAGAALISSSASALAAHQGNLAAGRVRQGTMDFQAWSMGKQQDYATSMASTAHQRQVNDMRAAGLNPILSATGGRGAAAPSPGGAAPGAGYDQKIPDLSSSALAAVRLRQEMRNLRATEKNTEEDTSLKSNQASNARAMAEMYRQQGEQYMIQNAIEKGRIEHGLYDRQAEFGVAEARRGRLAAEIERRIDQGHGASAREVQRWIPSLNIGSGALRNLRR